MGNSFTIQDVIRRLDLQGYEQDGSGYDFIRLSDGKRFHFKNDRELFFFACDNRLVG